MLRVVTDVVKDITNGLKNQTGSEKGVGERNRLQMCLDSLELNLKLQKSFSSTFFNEILEFVLNDVNSEDSSLDLPPESPNDPENDDISVQAVHTQAKPNSTSKKFHISKLTYMLLIQGLIYQSRSQLCEQVFRKLLKHHKPDRYTIHLMLQASIKSKNLSQAELYFTNLTALRKKRIQPALHGPQILIEGEGNWPSSIEYATMLNGYMKLEPTKVEDFSRRIIDARKFTTVTFNILLSHYLNRSETTRVNETLETMQRLNMIRIDSYNTILSSKFQKRRHVGGVLKVLNFIKRMESVVELDAVTYQNILSACMKNGLNIHTMKFREQALFAIREGKVVPDTKLLNKIIETYIKQGQLKGVLELFPEFNGYGWDPDTRTLNLMLKGVIQSRQFSIKSFLEVYNMFEYLMLKPDEVTLRVLVAGLTLKLDDGVNSEQRLEEALRMYKSGMVSKMKIPATVYMRLIRGCRQHRRVDQMMELLNDMRVNDVPPLYTIYEDVVVALAENQRMDEALNYYVQLVRKETISTRKRKQMRNGKRSRLSTDGDYVVRQYVYNMLIQHAVRSNRIRLACLLYQDLKNVKDQYPNAFTINFLIIGLLPFCGQGGRAPLISIERRKQRPRRPTTVETNEIDGRSIIEQIVKEFDSIRTDLWSISLLIYYYSAVVGEFALSWRVWSMYKRTMLPEKGKLEESRRVREPNVWEKEHKYSLEQHLHLKVLQSALHSCIHYDRNEEAEDVLRVGSEYGIPINRTSALKGYIRRLRKWRRTKDAQSLKYLLMELEGKEIVSQRADIEISDWAPRRHSVSFDL
ncbi:hypothetical protein HK098_006022 [Nowakowskiella sp. JEL0407]|nr:hypothetical protein HK098_006022 [Nowakowskiella sp. JEL0407]